MPASAHATDTKQNQRGKARAPGAQPLGKEVAPAVDAPHPLLSLQRSIGNQAFGQVIQTKLAISSPGDAYEQEADRVADRIMRMEDPGPISSSLGTIHRKEGEAATSRASTSVHSQITGLRGGGEPLSPSVRAFFEPRFGRDLGHVRVHTGKEAADSARAIQARAYTVGKNIVFGAGQFAPDTQGGRALLAHELAHTIQQRMLTTVDHKPLLQCNRPSPPERPRLSFYEATEPLAHYTFLRRVRPQDWEALAATARPRTLAGKMETGEEMPAQAEMPRVTIPLTELLRPPLPRVIKGDMRTRLWPIVSDASRNLGSAASVIRDEIVARWVLQNQRLSAANVHIRLIDPLEVKLPSLDLSLAAPPSTEEFPRNSSPQVLAFDVDGIPISSSDGAIDLVGLDLLGTNNLEQIISQVNQEALTIATAGDLLVSGTAFVRDETNFWNSVEKAPENHTYNEIEAHQQLLMNNGQLGMFLFSHPEYKAELGDVSRQQMMLIFRTSQIRQKYDEFFSTALPREPEETMHESLERLPEEITASFEEGGTTGYTLGVMESIGYGVGWLFYYGRNSLHGGYPETRRQMVAAFRRGELSLRQVEQLDRAAAGRGAIVAFVNLALITASSGLAGPILGAEAALGETVLYGGATGAISSMAALTSETIVTQQAGFESPIQQRIWQQGKHSPEEIALGGVSGFGLGAGLALAGVAVSKLATLLSGSGPVAVAGEGWTSELVTEGTWRMTRPEITGEVIITSTQLRYQIPTGSGMRVVYHTPLQPGLAAEPGAMIHPSFPGATAATQTERIAARIAAATRVSEQHVASAVTVEQYLTAFRQEIRPGTTFGRGWDHTRFPQAPRGSIGRWRLGDPIDMPNSRGVYPAYETARSRHWRNRAHFELEARNRGEVVQSLDSADPFRRLSNPQLADIRTSGASPPDPRFPGRVVEIEHGGSPQRVRDWLEEFGFTREESRRLAEVSNPAHLMEVTPLEHAFFDAEAWSFGSQRADVVGMRWPGTVAADIRVQRPLFHMRDATIHQIIEAASQPRFSFSRAPQLRVALVREVAERGLQFIVPQ